MYFSFALRSSLKAMSFSVLAVITLLSCSSTQNVYDDDGIYNSGTSSTVQERAGEEVVQSQNTSKYKDFFQNGARQLEDIPEEGAIFTDIEEYNSESEGDYNEEYVDEETYQEGKSAWGEETGNSVVYVYNSSPFYGFNRFGYGGFGYGFNRFGYGSSYYRGFGFNNFGYGYNSFGYGGFVNAWNPLFYGSSFYNRPYFNGAYNGYGGTAIAYNNIRRRAVVNANRKSSASRTVAESRSRLRGNTAKTSRGGQSRGNGVSRTRPATTRGGRTGTTQTTRPSTSRTRPSGSSSRKRPSTSSSSRSRSTTIRGSSRSSSSRPSFSRSSSSSRSSGSRGGSSRGGLRRG